MVVGDVYEMKYNAFSSMDNLVSYGLATEKEGTFLDQQTTHYKYVCTLSVVYGTHARIGTARHD